VEKAIAFVRRDLSFFTEAKADALLELTWKLLGDPAALRALDVGCGTGETDALLGAFGELHGVDVSRELVRHARRRSPRTTFTHYAGQRLPYDDGSFDLAFAICVVHHVPPEQWSAFAAEIGRVVRPGGVVAIVEHNPLNPLTRLVVARCTFDKTAFLLGRRRALGLLRAGGLEPAFDRYMLFFPWAGRASRALERRLSSVPLGAQYIVAGRRRPDRTFRPHSCDRYLDDRADSGVLFGP
jgi:SAM-dependent methyltransferase